MLQINSDSYPTNLPKYEHTNHHKHDFADLLNQSIADDCLHNVLGVNSAAGTGKSTFLEKWLQNLQEKKRNVLYFNASEFNSFELPLLPLTTSIIRHISSYPDHCDFVNLQQLKEVAKQYFQDCTANYGFSKKLKNADDFFDSFVNRVDIKENFIQSLSHLILNFVNESKTPKIAAQSEHDSGSFPMVIIIDELEYCESHYIKQMLNCINTFLKSTNLKIILVADKKLLKESLQGQSSKNSYLHTSILDKCIPVWLDMPELALEDYYGLKDWSFLDTVPGRKKYEISVASWAWQFKINYRALDQIHKSLESSMLQLSKIENDNLTVRAISRNFPLREVLILFSVLKNVYPNEFYAVVNDQMSTAELIKAVPHLVPNEMMNDDFVQSTGALDNLYIGINEILERDISSKVFSNSKYFNADALWKDFFALNYAIRVIQNNFITNQAFSTRTGFDLLIDKIRNDMSWGFDLEKKEELRSKLLYFIKLL